MPTRRTKAGSIPHDYKYSERCDRAECASCRVHGTVPTFLYTKVVPLEKDLGSRNLGAVWQPHLDQFGRMHPVIWEARREVQRQSAASGLYASHMRSEFGGGGLSRVEMHHVDEFVYRQPGLGLGLAALGWIEGPASALEHIGDAVWEK